MVFNSVQFAVFFAVVYGLYRVLPHRAQNLMLLAASYVFYGAWDWRFLALLLGSTIIDFQMARYISSESSPHKRRLALIVSLVYNLGVLGFFKYFNFFADGLARMFAVAGWHLDAVTLHVVLPMGISFYTFMTLSYVIDVYRNEIAPESNLIDFALFVAYFPHLVAGPILRASRLLPQIARPRTLTPEQNIEGMWLFGWGLFQKMFVADNLAEIVSSAYHAGSSASGTEVLVATYAFAFQIYGDFAGYSNMARGISKLLGIELNINFRFPYFVASPQEFWRHWHISLSTWLRDYLYIPLGGSRGSEIATLRNLMITMVLGGLWHGADWRFVPVGCISGPCLGRGTWHRTMERRAQHCCRSRAELAAGGAHHHHVPRHLLRLADLPCRVGEPGVRSDPSCRRRPATDALYAARRARSDRAHRRPADGCARLPGQEGF